jgi:hypothetical protein
VEEEEVEGVVFIADVDVDSEGNNWDCVEGELSACVSDEDRDFNLLMSAESNGRDDERGRKGLR